MTQKVTEFTSSLLSIAEEWQHFHHPGLRYVRFVFCDDKPNQNKQGVEYEDFAEVIASAINTPIKMRFLGEAAGSHIGSVSIGHITDMEENTLEDGTHQLIADGVLYASEYPDEIEYLEEAFADNKAPGISFEINYDASKAVVKDGVTWIKSLLTRAATFVRNPAYGTRTALLALASNNSLNDKELAEGLSAIANELRPKITIEGGNNKVEEDLKKVREELDELKLKLSEAATKITDLETANASLTTEKDELQKDLDVKIASLATVAREQLIATRTAAVAEAGMTIETDEAKLTKKQEFWAKMDEEGFAEYVEDLKAAAKVAPKKSAALASASRNTVPRIVDTEETGLSGLRERLGSLSRTTFTEEEE